jgi:hypothetical protein
MNRLANKKGYRLVGANAYGFNMIYVRNDIGTDLLPEVSVASVLQHPATVESFKVFDAVRDLPYVEG